MMAHARRTGPKSLGKGAARSGIRTRGGHYKKFDSQRVREVEEARSENESDTEQSDSTVEEEEDDNEDDGLPAINAYQMLLSTFEAPSHDQSKARKRRKLEHPDPKPDIEDAPIDQHMNDDQFDGDNSEPIGTNARRDGDERGLESASEDGDLEDDHVSDPYESHFAMSVENELPKLMRAVQGMDLRTEKQTVHNRISLTVSTPINIGGRVSRKHFAKIPDDLPLKHRLHETAKQQMHSPSNIQQELATYVFNYTDLVVGTRNTQNAGDLRMLASLHAVNHILKGRDRVLKNTARLSQADENEIIELRDQGFTRPKVLFLLETRQACARYADCIIDLFSPDQQENKQRFQDSFSEPSMQNEDMPEDYRELFEGNNDNSFVTTIKFTRKTLKFFSAFYASDIILASPLGLRRIIEHEDKRKRDYDYLSSIEVTIVDQADAMQMQNWENVELVFKHLNLQPKDLHGCDVNRVRTWYLDNNARFLRQTMVFTAYLTPEMNKFFNTTMVNVAGKAKMTSHYQGAIQAATGLGIKQTFSRFASPSPADDPDARFKFFTTVILPTLLRLPRPSDGAQGILIFIPSYFDFLRVRNFFAASDMTSNISFGAISDYSKVSEQRRARSHFLSGRHSILLYTQRAHHFFRLRIRGVKRMVTYGIPDNEVFYQELVAGFLGTTLSEGKAGPGEIGSRCIFSKWDALSLERVVGSERVKAMLGGVGDTFDFV